MSAASPGSRLPAVTARERHRAGELQLLDIREAHERITGMAAGAEGVAPDELQARLAGAGPTGEVALICERGERSAEAVERYAAICPVRLSTVEGGMQAWRRASLPVAWPESDLSPSERTRYQRHFALAGVGLKGQERLRRSAVLIAGAGGLGSPSALYLAAAGVGRITIVDDDRVELSNLQRQVLHDEAGIGRPKCESARETLGRINGDIEVRGVYERIGRDNVEALIGPHDLVLDGSDNFPTRYLLNDACIRLRRPLVYGAVERFVGQVGVFRPGDGTEPCYRCLFPTPPTATEAPSCAEAGVLGVLPGVIGTLQAVEALKLLLGLGLPLTGHLVHYDALQSAFRRVRIGRDPDCRWCDPERGIDAYPDYEAFCRGS